MKEMLTIKLSQRDGDGWRLAYVFQISAIDLLTRILVCTKLQGKLYRNILLCLQATPVLLLCQLKQTYLWLI